jgi:hypothetical protein
VLISRRWVIVIQSPLANALPRSYRLPVTSDHSNNSHHRVVYHFTRCPNGQGIQHRLRTCLPRNATTLIVHRDGDFIPIRRSNICGCWLSHGGALFVSPPADIRAVLFTHDVSRNRQTAFLGAFVRSCPSDVVRDLT